MSKHIAMDELSATIQKYLYEYHEDITEETRAVASDIAREALAEIRKISPVSENDVYLRNFGGNSDIHKKGSYASGWTISSQNSGNKAVKKLWNKTDYRLTHLLEFGHATRNGGRAKAIPHIRDTEKTYLKKFEQKLEKEISK